jgi:ABC-2 type transport system permease protein
VLGYLMFAALMTATGMVGRTAQESAQLSTIWILLASAPWFFIANIGAAPNGPLARVLSFIPLTSPITMMMRISSTEVPPLEIAAAIAVDATAIYLALRGAARIFRAAALMYGKRATLPELMRWLRAA